MRSLRLFCLRCLLAVSALAAGLAARADFNRFDPWLGQNAYWKETAEAKDGDTIVNKRSTLAWLAMVKAVQGGRLWLGHAWVKKEDVMTLPEALGYYLYWVTRTPNDPIAWRRLGVCQLAKRDWAPAEKSFTAALKLSPADYLALVDRSGARTWLRDYDGAISDINQVLATYPTSASLYRARGIVKLKKKNYTSAIQDMERAIELDPKNARRHADCGLAKRFAMDYDGALAELEIAIQMDPASPFGYLGRGSVERRKHDWDGALRDFEKAIELDPHNADAHGGRGAVKMYKQDYAAACEEYDAAIRCDPEDIYVLNGKAYLLAVCPVEKYRDPRAALLLADKALQLDPDFAHAKGTKACVLALEGEFDKAIELQTEALKDDLYRFEEQKDAEARLAAWKKKQQWPFEPAK